MRIAAPAAVGVVLDRDRGKSAAGLRLGPGVSVSEAERHPRTAWCTGRSIAVAGACWSRCASPCRRSPLPSCSGTLIAFMFVQSRAIEVSLFPYAVLLQVTPIVAIAPLIIILVKNTQLSLTICATLVALFPIISNTTLGSAQRRPGPCQLFPHEPRQPLENPASGFEFPARCPISSAACAFPSGLALIGAVVAEFVAGTGGRSSGLAYQILDADSSWTFPAMFAALFLITVDRSVCCSPRWS